MRRIFALALTLAVVPFAVALGADPAAATTPPVVKAAPEIETVTGAGFSGEPIQLLLRNADIRGAVNLISTAAGLNVVFDSRVQGRITHDFIGPWDGVLTKLLEESGFSYKVAGNAIVIGPQDSPLMDPHLLARTSTDNPVSLNVTDAALQDIVDTFAKTGMKFDIAKAPLRGSVTTFVSDVPAQQELRMVLAANGYTSEEHDGTLVIWRLPGIERFAGVATRESGRCQSGSCDDMRVAVLRGTLTPKKEGSKTRALFEFSSDRFASAEPGDNVGTTAKVIDATPEKVTVSDRRSGGADVRLTFDLKSTPLR